MPLYTASALVPVRGMAGLRHSMCTDRQEPSEANWSMTRSCMVMSMCHDMLGKCWIGNLILCWVSSKQMEDTNIPAMSLAVVRRFVKKASSSGELKKESSFTRME
eukprot:7016435-Heterocapsa_arctica.AAC.1